MIDNSQPKKRAFLVTCAEAGSNKAIAYEHLEELALLVDTEGLEVIGKEAVFLRSIEAATYVTRGKLEELVKAAHLTQAEIVIFDDEIAPSQARNLEAAFGLPVIDRTEVILDVFAQRAKTKEARLQIELAQVKYQAPRLKRLWTHLSRQSGTGSSGGGGAYLKGEGEKQIEIDRRILKNKIDELQKELSNVKREREILRVRRQKNFIPTFACVGYTNVGKSTLMGALTGASLFIEDKLFATLDTTTRKMRLKNNQEILVTDTVGFIRKLPHLLVAAFKSTLEESLEADILIHVIDASHPMAEEQAKTTFEVLKELGAKERVFITLLNKCDLCVGEKAAQLGRLMHAYPHTIAISAKERIGFDELENKMIEAIARLRTTIHLRIPQAHYEIVAEIMAHGEVISIQYEENEVLVEARLPTAMVEKFKKTPNLIILNN